MEQRKLLEKHFGCTRLIFNLAFETKKLAYAGNKVSLSRYDLQKQLVELKEAFPFLKEINRQSLQVELLNLAVANDNFFKKRKQNAGLPIDQRYCKKYVRKFQRGELEYLCLEHEKGYPKFKSKYGNQSFQCPQNVFIDTDKIYLPKFKTGIKIILHRPLNGKIKTVTISKTTTGKYFASVLVETPDEIPITKEIRRETTIGIDRGIKDLAVLSDGSRISNPKYLEKSLAKLKWQQKRLKKKKKGSNREKCWKKRIAKTHEKIKNQRKDFLHKESLKITNLYDTIVFEDLNIKGMSATCKPIEEDGKFLPNGQSRKKGLNRAINDAGWGMFESFVRYKGKWQGDNVLDIDRFVPSSKECSVCGEINHDLTLADRYWTCPKCKTLHDRDLNAAINIKNYGLKARLSERQCQDIQPPSLEGALLLCQSSSSSLNVLEANAL